MSGFNRSALLAVLLAVTLTLGGCSSAGSSNESAAGPEGGPSGTLTAAWDAAPENWAPGADNIDGMMRVPYETLIQRTQNNANEFKPMLATDWTVTDHKVTLHLRKGVTFHDGTPFNAEAVKTNLEYVINGGGPFTGYLKSVRAVNVVDDHTVEIVLKQPDPAIEAALASRAGFMGSPTAINNGSIQEAPVGTGPWAYDAKASSYGTAWVFNYYDGYYDPHAVKVRTIKLVGMSDPVARFAAVKSGKVDVAEQPAGQVPQAEAAGLAVKSVPGTHVAVMMVNRGPGGTLENVETRRAVCSSIDVDALGLVGGKGTRTMTTQRFTERDYGYNPAIKGWRLDPQLAKKAAGLNLTIGVFDGIAQDVKALVRQFAVQHIKLEVRVVPAAQYFADWFRRWDIGIGDNTEMHPYLWYRTWFAADAPKNASRVESPELKAAADKAIAAGSTPEAKELWQKVMQVINDEALVCAHSNSNFVATWNPKKVKNVELFPYWVGFVDYRKIAVVQ